MMSISKIEDISREVCVLEWRKSVIWLHGWTLEGVKLVYTDQGLTYMSTCVYL